MNTFEFIRVPAQIVPDREAVLCDNRRYTFAQLEREVMALAAGLREQGVGKGHVVAALDRNSDRYMVAFFAVALLGGSFVPLNYRARQDELAHLLAVSHVQTLLAGEHYHPIADAASSGVDSIKQRFSMGQPAAGWPALSSISISKVTIEPAEVDDDVCLIIFTSGSAQKPKGVMLRYADLWQYVIATTASPSEHERCTHLLVAPFYHIAGLTPLVRAPYAGRRLVILPHFQPREWLETVQREHVTHAFLVPTMLKRLIDEPTFHEFDLSSLEVLGYGAAPMPPSVLYQAIALFPRGTGFVNAYGQTEATGTVAMLWPEDHRLEGSPEEIERKRARLRSIGKPLLDVQLRIVDERQRAVPANTVGEIAILTTRSMKGYLREEGDHIYKPVKDEAGWLYTSDLGWIDDDGYVFLAGRASDQIIRGGENISPTEVEAILQRHPAVEDVAVLGIPDEEWGERVVAAVVLHPKARDKVTGEELIAFAHTRLASFKKPERVVFLDELPRSPLGKVLKPQLRECFRT